MSSTWFSRWLNRKCGAESRDRKPARLVPYRPRLEFLEQRLAPALAVTDLTQGITATNLVQNIVGAGVTVSNVQYTGANTAAGTFTGGNGILGFDSGIMLSTGNAKSVIGPYNGNDSATTDLGQAGDANLTTLAGGQTFDAAVLQFDFVPTTNMLSFNYVFTSEEYNDYANSDFNDIFAFLLNGKNVALLPCTNTPVSVNTVNGGKPLGTNPQNPQLFIDNEANPHLNINQDGLTVVLPVTATVTPNQVNHIKLAIADTGDPTLDSNVFIQQGSFSGVPPAKSPGFAAVGSDFGGPPEVKVFSSATGALIYDFNAYDPSFRGGVRTAIADVNGDGTPDIITAPGRTGGPDIRVFDGKTGSMMAEFLAYDASFTGGVFVAAGDTNGDGKADIITAPDAGGGPLVRVFSGADGSILLQGLAYNPFFTGGVRVAAGDVNGDGKVDIITGAGPGGGPHVKAFSGVDGSLLQSFFAYSPSFSGGVYVAAGNFGGATTTAGNTCSGGGGTTSSHADIVTGAGPGGGPQVNVFDNGTLVQSFFADFQGSLFFNDGGQFHTGVRVGVAAGNTMGTPAILVSFGPPHDSNIKVFNPFTGELVATLTAFPGQNDGVFIGGQ